MHTVYNNTHNTCKNESKHSEMGPVRQNPAAMSFKYYKLDDMFSVGPGPIWNNKRQKRWPLKQVLIKHTKEHTSCSRKLTASEHSETGMRTSDSSTTTNVCRSEKYCELNAVFSAITTP